MGDVSCWLKLIIQEQWNQLYDGLIITHLAVSQRLLTTSLLTYVGRVVRFKVRLQLVYVIYCKCI